MNLKAAKRKPGRPRAVPEALTAKILSPYYEGLGYWAVARELRREVVSVDWSNIRRIVKTHPQPGIDKDSDKASSNTILTLGDGV